MTSRPIDSPREGYDAARAIALLLLAIVGFLWPALSEYPDGYYCGADLTQDYALFEIDPEHKVGNPLLGDPILEMLPWALFNRDELRAGRIPFWNPYNGAGVPHLANYQSGVFSVFNLPFYVLPLRDALILSAALKLLALGFFTYLFLREIGASFWPAMLGALAFMLSGKSVLLLAYPHSGVSAALPASLFFVERALRALEGGEGRPRIALAVLGLCATFTVALYAGHPEPLAVAIFVAAAYVIARAFGAWRKLGRDRAAAASIGKLALSMAAAGVLAVGLAMPQVATFWEYLSQSITFKTRVPVTQPSLERYWPLLIFPNAFGGTTAGWHLPIKLLEPNYEQVNCSYPGALVLWIGLLGACCVAFDRRARFFAAAVLAWLALTCDVAGLGRWYDSLPRLPNLMPLSRSQAVWLFGLAVLGAIALEHLLAARARRRWLAAIATVVAACVGLWLAVRFANRPLADQADLLAKPAHRPTVTRMLAQEAWIVRSSLAGVVALAAMLVVRSRALKLACVVAALGVVLFQNGWLMRDYNPTIARELVYPRSEAIETLQRHVGDARVVVLGDNGFPPDTNLPYRLATLQSYDALAVPLFESYFDAAFEAYGGWRDAQSASSRSLAAFGVEYVVNYGDWPRVDTAIGHLQLQRGKRYERVSLTPGREVRQTFRSTRYGLSAVGLFAAVAAGKDFHPTLRLRLLDEQGATVAERTFSGDELRERAMSREEIAYTWMPFRGDQDWLGKWLVLEFPPVIDSKAKRYTLVIDSPASSAANAPLVWTSSDVAYENGELALDGERVRGVLLFDHRHGQSPLEPVAHVRNYTLFRHREGLGPFFTVSRAVGRSLSSEVSRTLHGSGFDPYRAVMLGGHDQPLAERFPDPAEELEPAARAEVLERTPCRMRLRCTRETPGFLVACHTAFPGWTATVDGVEVPVRRANIAFQAVPVPAGVSEVVFEYEPTHWRASLIAAATSALLAIVGFGLALRGGRPAVQSAAR